MVREKKMKFFNQLLTFFLDTPTHHLLDNAP